MSDNSITRPALIGRLIDFDKRNNTSDEENFKDFLLLSDQAVKDCFNSNLAVTSSYKVEGTTAIDDKEKNDSLLQLFMFYCRIQTRYQTTFEDIDVDCATMTFKELVIFSRDLELIPKLLSVDDLKYIWEMKNNEFIKTSPNGQNMLHLYLDDFKDFIVRMALFTYHKPGIKKLIVEIDGFIPKNTQILHYFCTYLHLYDHEWIYNFIRTTGKQTQGRYNFRSIGEVNDRLLIENFIDQDAKHYAQIDYSTKPITSLSSTSMILTGGIGTKSGGINLFGDKLKNPVIIEAANPYKVITERLDAFNSDAKKTRLPDFINRKLSSVSFSGDVDNGDDNSSGDNGPEVDFKESIFSADSSSYNPFAEYGTEEYNVMEVVRPVTSAFRENSLSSVKKAFLKEYYPSLALELLKYCYVTPKVVLSDIIIKGGPFIDLGLVRFGNDITISLEVTNTSDDVLNMDVSTRNFLSNNTKIATYSKPLIAGFTRPVVVTFTVEIPCKRTVIAYIDVIALAVRNGISTIIRCPVHYRVDPLSTKNTLHQCTLQSLPFLLDKYFPKGFDENNSTKSINFERKKIEGTWSTVAMQSKIKNKTEKSLTSMRFK